VFAESYYSNKKLAENSIYDIFQQFSLDTFVFSCLPCTDDLYTVRMYIDTYVIRILHLALYWWAQGAEEK
jgi:hypothetical protein